MNKNIEEYTEEQMKDIEERFTEYITSSIKEIAENYKRKKTEKNSCNE